MIEDDELRAIYFDPDEFGEEVEVAPTTGAAFTILAIFDARPTQADPAYNGGARVSGANPKMTCRTSDFPKSLIGQCTVTVRGEDYNAFDAKPDSTGMTCVELKRK